MKGKIRLALICISLILLSSYGELSPAAHAQTNSLFIGYSNTYTDYSTRYMTSEQIGNAYGLNITETSSATYYEYEEFGLTTAYWGFRAWKAFSNGSEQYITFWTIGGSCATFKYWARNAVEYLDSKSEC
jgi:hypothetical protein